MEIEKLIVFEAFAGYGGASFGLKRSGLPFEVIGQAEIEPSAKRILEVNFPTIPNFENITEIADKLEADPNYLPAFNMFTGGFPCQPFSTAGLQMGDKDKKGRGTLIYDIVRICQIKQPKYILLENVKGFMAKKFDYLRDYLKEELSDYQFEFVKLNSKDYGIPQSRERVWIFGRLGGLPENFDMYPDKVSTPHLEDFLDKEPPASTYLSEAQIEHLKVKHNIPNFKVAKPACLDIYNHKLKQDGLCITITQPEHNGIRIVEVPKKGKEIVRKLSVTEQFRLMGFNMEENEIIFPPELTYTKLSTRAGNGWDVNLVGKLLNKIFSQL